MSGSEHSGCVRYEMTQREFRRRLGEKWSPSFISKFGKLASRLYREVYKKRPPCKLYEELYKSELHHEAADFEPINLYPYGILVQAYRRLIAAGEQIGEPYREPHPDLKPEKPTKVLPQVRPSFTHARSKEIVMRMLAERRAKIVGQPLEPPEEGR